MSSAASAANPAPEATAGSPRRDKPSFTRRSVLQLLIGLLVVAGIPVVATVRILDASALRNERAHADSALRAQLQQADARLQGLSDNASTHAEDLTRQPQLQRAFLTNDRGAVAALARRNPGIVFYLHGRRVAGQVPAAALTRSVSLALNGVTVGRVVATLQLDARLERQLVRATAHAPDDRLLLVRRGVVLGSGERVGVSGQTVTVGGKAYRGGSAPVANAPGVHLLALRPERAISRAVAPYEQRVLYAAIGSFALLVLAGLLFGGPILRSIGDFRRVVSQAATDSLTGLANRWRFDEELALEWRRAERVGDSLGLILADLDDFKSVNDGYGHPVGDEVLRRIAEILGGNIRQVDLAARYGGEEFAVIVPEADLEGAVKLAERLRTALEENQIEFPGGKRKAVTASFGVAVKGDLPRAEELIAAADEALYESKRAGKNRVSPRLAEPAGKPRRPAERRKKKPAAKKPATKAKPSP
jgi:diguanylate cyclase (GGDEF)-like protein